MKNLKLVAILFASLVFSLNFVSCKDSDEENISLENSEYVGVWHYSNDGFEGTLDIKKSGTFSYAYKWDNSSSFTTISGTWSTLSNGQIQFSNNIYYSLFSSWRYATLVGDKLYIGDAAFSRIQVGSGGNDNKPSDPIVGNWKGTDESDTFYCKFESDGTYTDYLVQNGSNKFPVSGKYAISGNTLTLPSDCNINNSWGAYPNYSYTISFSSDKNTMTLTNDLLNKWGMSIVLKRQ